MNEVLAIASAPDMNVVPSVLSTSCSQATGPLKNDNVMYDTATMARYFHTNFPVETSAAFSWFATFQP